MSAGNAQSGTANPNVIGGVDITTVQDEDIAFELGAEETIGGPLTDELNKEDAAGGGPLEDRLAQMQASADADPDKAESLSEAQGEGEFVAEMSGLGGDREDEDEDTGDFDSL